MHTLFAFSAAQHERVTIEFQLINIAGCTVLMSIADIIPLLDDADAVFSASWGGVSRRLMTLIVATFRGIPNNVPCSSKV